MTQQEKRQAFIEHQKQFYKDDDMYDSIAQFDQQNAILGGSYDEYIDENFEIKLTVKEGWHGRNMAHF